MDPRTPHLAAEDILYLSLAGQNSRSPANTKRFAHYFSPPPSLVLDVFDDDDAESTWEFVAPTPSPRNHMSPRTSCDTKGSSAAQEIVARYRAAEAGKQFADNRTGVSDDVDASSLALNTASADTQSLLSTTPPSAAIKPRFSQSRCGAQAEARVEAMSVMQQSNLGTTDALVCQRSGCHDTLKDVKALTFHIHIHNVHDRAFICSECDGRFESNHELSLHRCHRHSKSPPMSPIRESFRRLFAKISWCHDQIAAPT